MLTPKEIKERLFYTRQELNLVLAEVSKIKQDAELPALEDTLNLLMTSIHLARNNTNRALSKLNEISGEKS